LIGDNFSDESDNSEGRCSDEEDDDASADSTDSLGQHVKSKEDPIPGDAFDLFKFWMPRIWEYYKPHLLNDVVRVSHLLSPDPTIMTFASKPENRDPEDRLACERLISKMFVPNHFLRKEEQEQEEARLIDKFWQEHNDFWTKQGYFKSRHIWITAENPDCIAHEWHKNYSSPFTEVLGRLGCKTSSNLLGIGEAERHWKVTKRNKGGNRANLGTEKTKKQAAIAAAYSHEKSSLRRKANQKAGKLYEDKDFNQFHGKGLWEERKRIPIRLFRAWYEGWESLQLKSTGDDRFAAALTAKYGGLKFYDIDGPLNGFPSAVNGFTLEDNCCVLWKLNEDASEKPVKGYGYKYCILLCFPGFDINEPHDRQPQKYWSLQELYKGCDFYSMVEDYYKQHPEEAEEIGLKIYRNDGVIDEMTELEAYKIAQKRMQVSSDGEQITADKEKKKRRM
jgi:hypothetical protein